MSGPQFGPRQALPLDLMLKQVGGDGFSGLDQLILPGSRQSALTPKDEVCKSLVALCNHGGGRAVIEWLMDITIRQDMGTGGKSFEEMALVAKQKQTLDMVAKAILAAIDHGEKLTEKRS